MPRKPLGEQPMTPAERQKRTRQKRKSALDRPLADIALLQASLAASATREYALRTALIRIAQAAHTPFSSDFDRSLAMATIAEKALDGSLVVN